MANASPSPGETAPASLDTGKIVRFVAIAGFVAAFAILMITPILWLRADMVEVRGRVADLKNRINTLEYPIDRIENRLAQVDNRLTLLQDRTDGLEGRVAHQEGVTSEIVLLVERRQPRRAPEIDNGPVE